MPSKPLFTEAPRETVWKIRMGTTKVQKTAKRKSICRISEPPERWASHSRMPTVRQGSSVRQCQKCQKPPKYPSGTFGTPSVSVFGKIHALLTHPHYARVRFFSYPLCTLRICERQ
jgi:hypothetical protein